MGVALRDFIEVQLPGKELTSTGTGNDDSLRAANNRVEFLDNLQEREIPGRHT